MPAISIQTVMVAIAAALITAIGSVIVAFITTRKHPTDVSSMLMNEALDLVESLRSERVELRTELTSLRTEIAKCREEISQLRQENQKLRISLMAYGGTIDEEIKKTQAPPDKPSEKAPEVAAMPQRQPLRHQRPPRRQR